MLVVALALAIRLILWPYASQDTNDHASRIFIGWRWADNPFLFLHGRWPTLHLMLVGAVIRFFHDTLQAPVLLHVLLGSLVPGVLYVFTAREFRVRTAALAVALCCAFYPIAIRTSLEVLAQAPFSLCVALTLLALSKARESGAQSAYVVAAGVALTLATQLRTEGCVLVPLCALCLWPNRRKMLLFAVVAAVGPVAAMVANNAYYGQPLFPLTAASEIMRNDVGAGYFTLVDRIRQPLTLLRGFAAGMTPLFALCASAGAVLCIVRRDERARWIFPFAGLAASMMIAAALGTLIPKPIYTESLGILLAPFAAAVFQMAPGIDEQRSVRVVLYAALVTSTVAICLAGAARSLPESHGLRRIAIRIPMLGESPVPTFARQRQADRLVQLIREHRTHPQGALILDNLRSPATYYVGLHSGYHPDRLYLASGQGAVDLEDRSAADSRPLRQRDQPLRGTEPADIAGFMRQHCSGMIVLQPGSRFSAWIGYRSPDRIVNVGRSVSLHEIARISWPMPADERLLAADVSPTTAGYAVLFEYEVEGCR